MELIRKLPKHLSPDIYRCEQKQQKKKLEPNVISFQQKYIRYVFFILLHKMPSKTLTNGRAATMFVYI